MSGKRHIKPSKEELLELYQREGSTISSLARKYGTTQPTVRNWLKSYEIPRKSQKQASTEANNRHRIETKPNKTQLERLYKDSTIKGLETYFGVSQQTIYKWLEEYDIPIKSLSESCKEGKERQFADKRFTKEFLDLEYDRTQNIMSLAKKLGVSRSYIRHQLITHGIEIAQIEPSYRSLEEAELYNYLVNQFPDDDWSHSRKDIISPYELDIVNHTKKVAIEYCGLYWHSEMSLGKRKYYHRTKYDLCKEKEYKLITIFSSDDKSKVRSLLLKLLGKTKRVYARETTFERIKSKQAIEFHKKHHLHSSVGAKYHYGLFKDDYLLMVASFGQNRFSKHQQYECTRITSHSDITVVGGVSKLIKNFIKEHNPISIITFADLRFGDGNVYHHCGFDYVENTSPNYWYSYKYTPPLFSRVKFQKHKLKDQLEFFDPLKTEYENMIDNGWDRIWDCGNAKYVYKKGEE